jgi:hypothetical protein
MTKTSPELAAQNKRIAADKADMQAHMASLSVRVMQLQAQRDALLVALKGLYDATCHMCCDVTSRPSTFPEASRKASEALAAGEAV